jgi:uncharacterized membrane protein YkoI
MKAFCLLLLMIATTFEDGHASAEITLAKVTLDEATRQVLKEGKKRVLGATTETINGREVHIIKVLTPDGRIQHFKIDAETGTQVS